MGSSSRRSRFVFSSLNKVSAKRPQPGKPVAAVHIMLDDIKREVVEPAKTPDRDSEQYGDFQRGLVQEKQHRSEQTDEKEQNALELDQSGRRDVFHR